MSEIIEKKIPLKRDTYINTNLNSRIEYGKYHCGHEITLRKDFKLVCGNPNKNPTTPMSTHIHRPLDERVSDLIDEISETIVPYFGQYSDSESNLDEELSEDEYARYELLKKINLQLESIIDSLKICSKDESKLQDISK